MDLENIILSEVWERQIPYDITHMPNLKCNTNEPTYETDTEYRHREQCYGYQGGERLGRMSWEVGRDGLGIWDSVQLSCSVVSDSLWPHESQHIRPPCPSPTPGVYPNSCPLRRWCHPAISSAVVPFSSCPQSLPASGSFPMSQLFASGGQSIWPASASVLPVNTQNWSPLGWTGWISL